MSGPPPKEKRGMRTALQIAELLTAYHASLFLQDCPARRFVFSSSGAASWRSAQTTKGATSNE